MAKKNIKITKISSSYSIKKQVHQFEPVEVFMAAEAEINSDDEVTIKNAQLELFETVRVAAEAMIGRVT